MSLLDQLWDDTVAGPRPDYGLGKLRKQSTFSSRSSSAKDHQLDGGKMRSYGEHSPEEGIRVTRSIMIVKPLGYQNGSPPISPAGSTPPVSPFAGSRSECCWFRRNSSSEGYEKTNEVGPRSPTSPYNV